MEKTIIMVAHGNVGKIAQAFNVSKALVSLSLRGHRLGDRAKKIRHVALTEYDGVEMMPVNKSDKKKSL